MKYENLWRAFALIAFGLICLNLFFLSSEVVYSGVPETDEYNATLDIDLCYATYIERDHCHSLQAPDAQTPKKPFTCDAISTERIGCFTEGLEKMSVSQIISSFEGCNIISWAQVSNLTIGVTAKSQELLFFNGFVCVRHRFNVHEKKTRSKFSISEAIRSQPFSVYITYTRDYVQDGRYKTKNTYLFERACWPEKTGNESHNCTESGRKVMLQVELYSIKHLESSDCVHRTDSNGQTTLQGDCYRNCTRTGEKKFYFETYYPGDQFTLEYQQTTELKNLLDRCADSCRQDDCKSMSIYVSDIHEKDKGSDEGQIILDLAYWDQRREAIPLLSTAKLIWMIVAFVSIFFGASFYGMLMKSGNLHHFYNFAAPENKWRKRKNKKLLAIALLMTSLSLGMGFAYEKLCFDFGREKHMAYLLKDTIEERSVSVSICYDLCNILLPNAREHFTSGCNLKELRQNWTINEINNRTWTVSEFKKNTAVRNNARQHPIRQSDFPIQYFFRDSRKCFLVHYETKNYWPHFAVQRYSRVHINNTGNPLPKRVPYAHFFIEDGFGYPQVEAVSTNISVLHSVYSEHYKDNCVDYSKARGKTRDELVRQCIIEKSLKEGKGFPAEAMLREDDKYTEKNASLKFNEDPVSFRRWLVDCKKKEYPQKECSHSSTSLSYKDLLQDRDDIIVNLTPYLEDIQPFPDENWLIVANRIFSFFIIFTGLSIRELANAFISVYFFEFFSLRNFQLRRRRFHLALFTLFALHFSLLFCFIIFHPMLEFSYLHYATEVDPTAQVRFCTELPSDLNLASNNLKVKDLDAKTWKFPEIFENLLIFDEQGRGLTNLTASDFKLEDAPNIATKAQAWTVHPDDHTTLQAEEFYVGDMKCVTLFLPKNKTQRHLNVHYHQLHKLFTISFSYRNLNRTKMDKEKYKKQFYIFFNKFYSFDFDWDRPFNYGEFDLEFVTVLRRYQDDYHRLKTNPFPHLLGLVGLWNVIDNPIAYLQNLRNQFIKEQGATTTWMPLLAYKDDDLQIRNRQFNFYIQFRAMSSKANDYDFTRNTDRIALKNTAYEKISNKMHGDKITLNVHSNLAKYVQISRNRYRYVELFLHLFLLASLWFRVDIYSLPAILRKSYPTFRFWSIEFLYFFVSFLIVLFEIWFAFVRFLKPRGD